MTEAFENDWASYPEDNELAREHYKAGWEAGYLQGLADAK